MIEPQNIAFLILKLAFECDPNLIPSIGFPHKLISIILILMLFSCLLPYYLIGHFSISCCHSVQSLLSSSLLSRNIKIKIYKTIILPVILYGSLTLREEHSLRVFENRVLRRIFGPRRDEVGGSCTMRNFIICTHPQISLGKSR
jgi:hypothetical protein